MKDLFKTLSKDIASENFDAAEGLVYCGVAFFGMLILMVLSGLLEAITQ